MKSDADVGSRRALSVQERRRACNVREMYGVCDKGRTEPVKQMAQ